MEKPIDEFHRHKSKPGGRKNQCRDCCNAVLKRWRDRNIEKDMAASKAWREANPEKFKETMRRWREAPENYRKNIDRITKWRAANPEKVREYSGKYWRKRMATIDGRINAAMSSGVKRAIASKNGNSWVDLVGYTIDELMEHIERQFARGMTWENYGSYWHIDHIVPLCDFKIREAGDDEFMRAWGLPNLRPLEASENYAKGGKRIFLV